MTYNYWLSRISPFQFQFLDNNAQSSQCRCRTSWQLMSCFNSQHKMGNIMLLVIRSQVERWFASVWVKQRKPKVNQISVSVATPKEYILRFLTLSAYFRFRPKAAMKLSVTFWFQQPWCWISSGTIIYSEPLPHYKWCSTAAKSLHHGLITRASQVDLGVNPRSRLKSICTFQVRLDHFSLPSSWICLAPVSFMSSQLGDKILAIIAT